MSPRRLFASCFPTQILLEFIIIHCVLRDLVWMKWQGEKSHNRMMLSPSCFISSGNQWEDLALLYQAGTSEKILLCYVKREPVRRSCFVMSSWNQWEDRVLLHQAGSSEKIVFYVKREPVRILCFFFVCVCVCLLFIFSSGLGWPFCPSMAS